MEKQDYDHHRRVDPLYHMVLFGIIVLTLIGSCVNLYHSVGDEHRLYNASLLVAAMAAMLILFFKTRLYALKAQDRAIRVEENLRHYVLTGKLLDPRLSVRQIVGLRFASDDEFTALAQRGADEGLSEDAIKKAIKNWRADTDRV